ncbi:hyaluronan synthase [Kiloniella litopenaei]|uniref:Hyaluronan synthase n=1 Tax=Kiloniella litopenaei TaxID=1549748 RepID=A0A0M2R6E2_9PROT|nr:hydrogen peroxide-inducible genes activator [Kiloniella litopenaei]KKJ77221.1 hyaluronan synthase [Kiloniella litopenaei]
MIKPTIKQLEYFSAVAETLHFRKAAEQLHVSQPTLSDQIKELEYRLGVILLDRTRHGVELTPVGREILKRTTYLLRDLNDLCDHAKTAKSMLGGTLRLGVAPTVGPYLLPYVLPDLHRAYPDLKIYIREDRSSSLEQALRTGQHDLILTALPLEDEGLRTEALYSEPLMVGLPKNHRLASADSVAPQDLKGEAVLSLGVGHRLNEQVQELCREFGADLQNDYEGTSLDTLRQMVGMEMGISFFPNLYARSEITKDPEVCARPIETRVVKRQVGLAWRSNSPRINEFLQFKEDLLRSLNRQISREVILSG